MKDVAVAALPALLAILPVLIGPRKRRILARLAAEAEALALLKEQDARVPLLRAHVVSAAEYEAAVTGSDRVLRLTASLRWGRTALVLMLGLVVFGIFAKTVEPDRYREETYFRVISPSDMFNFGFSAATFVGVAMLVVWVMRSDAKDEEEARSRGIEKGSTD